MILSNIRRSNPSVDSSVFIHRECLLWQDPVVAAKLMRFTLMAPLARLPAHVLLLILRVNILLWVGESCSHIMGGPEPSLGVIDPRQHGPVVLENSIRPSWWTSCITSGYRVQVAL